MVVDAVVDVKSLCLIVMYLTLVCLISGHPISVCLISVSRVGVSHIGAYRCISLVLSV